jgi:hypothetical protein
MLFKQQAKVVSLLLTLLISSWAVAATVAPYAGQQTRSIKSLSEDDVTSLKAGKGWSLAKPAELNGVPGPAHLIELKEQLSLSDDQLGSIQSIQKSMSQSAKKYGELYLNKEAEIEYFFKSEKVDEENLTQLLHESAQYLAKLRHVHLQAHLKSKPLLTQHQLVMYQQLRGYSVSDNHTKSSHNH